MKDPNQVFALLEAVFQAFDHIAKKRGIYKVETIGDCYVGACVQ
jgi:class 3 adenylate cyclase